MRYASYLRRGLWLGTTFIVSGVLCGTTFFEIQQVAFAAGLSIDKLVSAHPTAVATSLTSPVFTTSEGGELLVAFLSADGPGTSGSQSFSGVTGGSLTWRLRSRANTQAGTAEIWTAVAPGVLTNASVKGTFIGSHIGAITVATFTGASTTVDGAVANSGGANGGASSTLTTTRPGSWVWGVGEDWDRAQARTVGSYQTKVDEYLAASGDSFWVQRQNTTTTTSGSAVTLNDTAPTNDRWNFASIEIPAATLDVAPPSVPTGVAANATGPNQVNVSWVASTDDTAVAGYKVLRGGVALSTTAATTYTDTTVSASTSYGYTIQAYDAVGNTSASSAIVTVTTPASDTSAPTISGVTASGISQTGATITWATDEPATSQVEYGIDTTYGSATTLDGNTLNSHSQNIGGLSATTTYHYRVKSNDAAGNPAISVDNVFTTLAPVADTTPPTISITSPTNGASIAGIVGITANASDNVGVASVQFTLDGTNLGTELTTTPFSTSWDTTTVTDGNHTLSAVAKDAAGNAKTAQTVSVTVANSTSNPATVGSWGSIITWPEVSIHAALTSTGKILTFQGDFSQGGQQYLYDPGTGSINQVPNAAADLFCAGQAVTADGRIMVIGGTSTSGGLGIRDVTAFDPGTQTWQNLAPMNRARWYATGTTLGDGRVLSSAGYDQNSTDPVNTPEIYNVQTNTWTLLQGATMAQPVYPFEYQLPDGRVLWAGASETPTATKTLDVNSQTWTTIDSRIIDGSSIVNYAPNKFMKAGSAADSGNTGPSSSTAFTLDMGQASPTWQPTSNMAFPRSFANLTALPDGTVLATGGDTEKSGYNDANGVLQAEQWNPTTGTWKTLAKMTEARLYHSVAVLLPDGRVFVSGGGGDSGVPDHKTAQIYSPPYLFKGARPTISSAPSTVQYASNTFVGTPDASSIASVSLIRTGSVTHSFDQNARAVPLAFTQTAGGLNIQMPPNGNTAPPGYYMLFIVNASGVPSVSSMVRFPAGYEDSTPPTAPTSLSAIAGTGTATLSWNASTDNMGVASYDVYRSGTSGFTPSSANKVGATTTTTFTDPGVAAGTYYYLVRAQDTAGNFSAASNEASATVLADTTPPTAPTNLATSAPNANHVDLSWTAATDNAGVTRYNVLRNGTPIGTTAALTYADTNTVANTAYTYTVTAQDAAGNVSPASNASTITTPITAAAISTDTTVSFHQSAAANTISVAGVTTTSTDELLVAFITSDGPSSGGLTFSSVSGGGLTWTLRKRANAQAGTAEIWTAVAPTALASTTVAATRSSGSWTGSISVVAFKNASTTAYGAVAGASATTGSPSVSLTTTAAKSWVWGVGSDWDKAVTHTVGSNQTKVDEYLTPIGDTFWVQSQTSPGTSAGTLTTINDISPTTDRWNLAAIEILPQ